MKKTLKLIGTLSRWLCAITFTVIIALTLTAAGCDNGTTGGGGNKNNPNTGYTQADLQGSWGYTIVQPIYDNRTLTVTLTFTGNRFTLKGEAIYPSDSSKNFIDILTGTFTVSGDIFTFTYTDDDEVQSGKFSISGNKLTLYRDDGSIREIYTKQ
jgi:hypothetical protein